MAFFTRGAHFWVMFAPLLIPMAIYVGFLWSRAGNRRNLRRAALLVIAGSLGLFVLSLLLGSAIIQIPAASGLFLGVMGAGGAGELIRTSIVRRLAAPGAWLTLLVLLSFTIALLWPRRAEPQRDTEQNSGDANRFVLLLILFGALLVLGSEFFYLRDFFGTRMNTIFKFYYQTWLMWSVAAAFGSALLLKELRGAAGVVFSLVLVVVIGVGLVYPVLGFWNKTEGFSPSAGWTLDGVAYLERQTPDDMAAIRWLAQAPEGVVAEAVGGSYSAFARVATISGKPNVLGWPGHESQWRGGNQEMGSRESDMRRLYCTRDWDEAKAIIDQYDIRYIFLGSLERSTYSPEVCGTNQGEAKFQRALILAFQQGDTTVYEVP
jgi:uncharacterized membrane protein